ncbi:Poly(U)-specific endoribonuclease [Symbiodinium microadriaticum]|uniref:Poly(U)-specific endoribonuclease n=1 Tax=Symbiodinium microadriaticum TaxID=2951 RepID=A0A1Q9CQA0_SYMMI|nr:Poly(U)-specific endoribonuclease [Symbiodinium microadriaticum]
MRWRLASMSVAAQPGGGDSWAYCAQAIGQPITQKGFGAWPPQRGAALARGPGLPGSAALRAMARVKTELSQSARPRFAKQEGIGDQPPTLKGVKRKLEDDSDSDDGAPIRLPPGFGAIPEDIVEERRRQREEERILQLKATQPCRFGKKCKKRDCPNAHPEGLGAVAAAATEEVVALVVAAASAQYKQQLGRRKQTLSSILPKALELLSMLPWPWRWTILLASWTVSGEIPSALDDALDAETCESGDCDVSLRQLRGRRLGLDQDSEDDTVQDMEAPTCASFGCGHFVREHPCQCTSQCSRYGNCCSDYKATCLARSAKVLTKPTCAEFGCGTKYIHHHPCQCTPECEKFGNCCADFNSTCVLHKDPEEPATATVTEPAAANATATEAPKEAVSKEAEAAKEPEAPPATATAEGEGHWANTVDGIVRTTKEAWISGSGKIDKTMTCETAQRGDECWTAVTWAMNDGIYEHPEWWPELQPGASSFEEFQGHQHLMNATLCPQPCMLRYDVYSEPTYRSSREYAMKGVSYGASPLKSTKVLLTDDDFMTDITGAMWDSWGRGDLDVLASMGVNTLRMYGNDLNYSHRSFLDGAWKRDIDVIVGLSDWGFIQGPDPCDKKAALIYRG